MSKALKIIGRVFLIILLIIVLLVAGLFVSRLIGKAVNNRTPEGGINETMYVDINGDRQWH